MEEKKTGLWKALTNKINTFLHNKELKEKLYVIIFESDTPKGKLFDVFLIGFIIMSVLVVILESVVTFSDHFRLALQILEYVFTAFFYFRVSGAYLLFAEAEEIYFQLFRYCRFAGNLAVVSGIPFHRCTLFTYYPDIPPDPCLSCV